VLESSGSYTDLDILRLHEQINQKKSVGERTWRERLIKLNGMNIDYPATIDLAQYPYMKFDEKSNRTKSRSSNWEYLVVSDATYKMLLSVAFLPRLRYLELYFLFFILICNYSLLDDRIWDG
jgi:hypothetical protein